LAYRRRVSQIFPRVLVHVSFACKLLKSIISKAKYENADKQGLITNAQFAYRPGRSTTLQLLDTQFDWAEHFNRS